MSATLLLGDSLELLPTLADNSVDSIVTDPPYGLSFMGKKWDYDVPSTALWAECLRVLKPGGHLLAFAGTRTQHRMAVRIEDAGFEIRDMIAWVYGSGFPKSLDVSKAIDKAAGVDREVTKQGLRKLAEDAGKFTTLTGALRERRDSPATDAARQWQGFGTALKPALEPITVARKPLIGTVAANVQQHGTGALNIDGCRIGASVNDDYGRSTTCSDGTQSINRAEGYGLSSTPSIPSSMGRWPANLIHDGSEEVLEGFPLARSSGNYNAIDSGKTGNRVTNFGFGGPRTPDSMYSDSGSAARFFYCAKTNKSDRGDGNAHPTVKPTGLMRYLCRLVTPPGGLVLDPFMGSGSTGKAALAEGFRFIGIERDSDYMAIAQARTSQAIAA